MTLWIKNTEYFEWEVPDELADLTISNQGLVDEYFNPDDISVDKVSADYYEIEKES